MRIRKIIRREYVKLVRFEDDSGHGPYRMRHGDFRDDMAGGYGSGPLPFYNGEPLEGCSAESYEGRYRCAFFTREQEEDWFNDYCVARLCDYGVYRRVFNVHREDVLLGKAQCVFFGAYVGRKLERMAEDEQRGPVRVALDNLKAAGIGYTITSATRDYIGSATRDYINYTINIVTGYR
jgi:hypothetical protein